MISRLFGFERALGYVTAGNVFSALIGASFWFILTSFLTVDSYGEVSYLMSLSSFFVPLVLFGMVPTTMTLLPKGLHGIISEARTLILIGAGCLGIVLAFFDVYLAFLMFGLVAFQVSVTELLALKQYKRYMLTLLGSAVLKVLLAIVLFVLTRELQSIIVAFGIAHLAFSVQFLLGIRQISFRFSIVGQHLHFVVRNYVATVAQIISSYVDKIVVGSLFSFAVLGNYQLGFQIYLAMNILPVSLYQYLLPQESAGRMNNSLKKKAIALSIVLAIIAYFASPIVIPRVFPQFDGAVDFTRLIVIAIVPMTIVQIANASLLGRSDNAPLVIGALLFLGTLVLGLIALGSILQLVGLALAVIISTSVQAAFLSVAVRHRRTRSQELQN